MTCCNDLHKILGGDRSCYEQKSSAREKGKIFEIKFTREQSVCRVKVDDGLIKQNLAIKQCDFLFVVCPEQSFYFLELKGSGVNASEACKQLNITIEYIKIRVGSFGKIAGIIVGGADTQGMNRLKEDFKRKYGGLLIHKTGNYFGMNA